MGERRAERVVRAALAVLAAIGLMFLMGPIITVEIPAGFVGVTSMADLDTCLEAGNNCYLMETVTYATDPAGVQVIANVVTLPTSFESVVRCAPGVEMRYHNNASTYDTGSAITGWDLRVSASTLVYETRPHRVTWENCTEVEYKNGVRCDPDAAIGAPAGGSVGGTVGIIMQSPDNLDETKATELIFRNHKTIFCASQSEGVGTGSPGAVHQQVHDSSIRANIPVLAKTYCSNNYGDVLSVADAGGGDIRVETSAAHGMVATDRVTIKETVPQDDNYETTFAVTNVSDTTHFDVEASFGATATGAWFEADCVSGNRILLVNNRLDVVHTGVCDDDGTGGGERCDDDTDCGGGGTCRLPNKPRAIKIQGDSKIVSSNNFYGGYVEYVETDSSGGFVHTFVNDFFDGPGVGAGTRVFDMLQYGETIFCIGCVVGKDWPLTSNMSFIYYTRGAFYGDIVFLGDPNFWEPGGKEFEYFGQAIVRSTDGETELGTVQLKVSGPSGSSPSVLFHEQFMLAAVDSGFTGWIDGGQEMGRWEYVQGELVPPQETNYTVYCPGLLIDQTNEEFVNISDCSLNATDAGAESALEAAPGMVTKIMGMRIELSEDPGGDAARWVWTVRGGPNGSRVDTDTKCTVWAGMEDGCFGVPGVLDPLDEITVEITPVNEPDCNEPTGSGCTADLWVFLNTAPE
jgi:hypothetical protein